MIGESIDLTGTRAVITGATLGVGLETARALAGTGAEVILAVPDTEAGERVAGDIRAATGNPEIGACPLDLRDLHSARTFADAWEGPLHLLVDSSDVNPLAHLALALGLHEPLAADGNARIVSYGRSKAANVLLAVGVDRRWAADGISVNAAHPSAAAIVFAATSPEFDGAGGHYFENRREADAAAGVARYALDPGGADRFWDLAPA